MLTDTQIERYSRQLILPEFGARGQQRLLDGAIAVVGAESIVIPAVLYLAAGGVGRLGVAMEPAPALWPSNPDCTIVRHSLSDVPSWLGDYDVLIDATEDDSHHHQVNAACIGARIPLLHGACAGAIGVAAVLGGHRADSACYACVADQLRIDPDGRDEFAPITSGIVATALATDALMWLLNREHRRSSHVLHYDAARANFSNQPLLKQPGCGQCGQCRQAS